MTLRILYVAIAMAMLITTGCRTSASYQPSCPPAVVATAPVVPPCPPGQLPPPPPPPPGGVLVPR